MDYDAIIFDNDGVLVTPTARELWRTASRLAFQDLGVLDALPDDIERMDGYSLSVLVRRCAHYGVATDEFWRRRETYAARAQRHEFSRGGKTTYDDVDVLHSLSVPVGIVSNNQQATIDFLIEYYGLDRSVEAHYGREPTLDGLMRMKPSSHYLRRAVDDLGAANPLYVGDSSVDVAAAADLGVDSAFIRRPHRTGYEPTPEPTYEMDSLADLHAICGTAAPTAAATPSGPGSR